MKKLIDIVSNRIFLTAVAVLLQLVWIFAVLWGVGAFSGHLMNLISILSLILVLWIVNKKINPSYKLAWTILILAVPVFGVIIYLIFGPSRVARKMTQDSNRRPTVYYHTLIEHQLTIIVVNKAVHSLKS